MLVILSGASGSGKDTVKNELMKKIDNLCSMPSYTTRKPREGETAKDYMFVTKEEFEKLIKENKLYEYSMHHDNYYGTSKEVLDDRINNGKIVIKDIDVNGTKALEEKFKSKMKIISIFLHVPKDVLIERLRNRGLNSEEEIQKRVGRLGYEEEFLNNYDYIIDNDNLEETVNKIQKIILEEYEKD